mmetsp:Transcript_11792/g.17253  ORF Transcript_11792/g.17253 Transcript_11792/m.17253 type:complete len:80 (+) Transcript_11792:705-944(+)
MSNTLKFNSNFTNFIHSKKPQSKVLRELQHVQTSTASYENTIEHQTTEFKILQREFQLKLAVKLAKDPQFAPERFKRVN